MSDPKKYWSKPVEIEAMQFTANNGMDVVRWAHAVSWGIGGTEQDVIQVQTLNGPVMAHVGDWVIRGSEGEFYPCKDSVFRRKYEATDECLGCVACEAIRVWYT